ncbi:MAG TPA: GAF domain-containing protein, partial [Chloroflexi bacterium]|nr:GAF domain-containing protein [Chloroflexota bacterium]
ELTKRGIDSIGTISLYWMGTPMIVANKVLGIIAVQNYTTPNAYDQRDLDLLSAIASQTAIALQNARLFEQVQRQAQREHQIYEITSRIRRSPYIKHILKSTVSELAQALQVDRAIVRLTTKEELQEQKGDGDGYSPDPTTATETERKTGEEQ